MITTDRPVFAECFLELSRVFSKPEPSGALIADYFQALEDYPIHVVTRAQSDLIRNRRFWPRPSDWRHACDTVQAAGRTGYAAPQTRVAPDGQAERLYECAACWDTGWRPECGCPMGALDWDWTCPQHPRIVHKMPYRQAMTACACRPSNATWQANRPRVSGAAREAGRETRHS